MPIDAYFKIPKLIPRVMVDGPIIVVELNAWFDELA